MSYIRFLGGITLSLTVAVFLTTTTHAIGPITSITIAPAKATMSAGTAQTFTVEGRDASGGTADITANSTFSITDPSGSLSANVYSAGKAGEWVVSAAYNNLTADATVTVTAGALKELVVNPNSEPEYVQNGATRTFSAEAFDGFNNKIDDFVVQWSLEGNIGVIKSISDNSAKFTATEVGSGRMIARSGDELTPVDVAVTKAKISDTTTNANVNAANVNRATTTTPTNTNVNAPPTNAAVTSEPTTQAETTQATATTCTAWPRSAWIWLFIGYAVLLVLSLYPIRRSKPTWWWVAPLVLTVASLWMYFQFRCYPVYPAWPYLILLLGIIVVSWYNWQRSENPPLS